jgi:hypothetical protein
MNMINIQGLDKVELLIALWEKQVLSGSALRKIASGFPAPNITRNKALTALTADGGYVEYLCGKFIDTDFSSDVEVDCAGYDHHVGAGAMNDIVESLRAPVLHAALNAVRDHRLQKPSVKNVESDGVCFWRCVLASIPVSRLRLLRLVDGPIDFAYDSSAAVFPAVNKLRTMTAEFLEILPTHDPVEWVDVAEIAGTVCREEGETLEQWLTRLKTPVETLEPRRRYADKLVYEATPRVFRKLGIDLRLETVYTIFTDENDDVVREDLSPVVPRIDINLACKKRVHGDVYRYDLEDEDSTFKRPRVSFRIPKLKKKPAVDKL